MSKPVKPKFEVITEPFEAFGVNLKEPRRPEGYPTAPLKYSLSIPLDPAVAAPILAQLKQLAKKEWPSLNDKNQVARENGDLVSIKLPLEKGDDLNARRAAAGKSTYPNLAGKIIFRANAAEYAQPPVCDLQGMPVAPGNVKGGDLVRAKLAFVPVSIPGSFTGITCYLNAVLVVKAREGRSAADAFKEFLGSAPISSDVNPFDL